MKDLKYSTYDFFAYALPGLVFIGSVIVMVEADNICKPDYKFGKFLSNNLTIYSSSLFVIVSYIAGFILNHPGNYFLQLFEKMYPATDPDHSTLNNSTKYVLARELSPANFAHIEKWNTMKSMCSNLAFIFFVSGILLWVTISCFKWQHAALSFIISFILLFQSRKFHCWSIIDLDNAVHFLDLENKAQQTE